MTNDCKTCPVSTGTYKPAEAVHQIDEPQAEALLELAAYRFTVANREARIAELEKENSYLNNACAELEAQLEAIGAGGVEPLRKPASQQAVQAAVPDGWQMVPAKPTEAMVGAIMSEGEVDAVAGLAPELRPILLERAGIAARYTAMLAAAPAHPAEGVPAQIETLRSELAEEKEAADNWRRLALQFDNHRLQTLWHLKRILHADSSVDEYKAAEQFLAAPPLDGEAVLAQRIADLSATHPTQQGMEQDAARYQWLRERDLETVHKGGVFAGMTPENYVLNGADLDAAIDAALAAQAKQGGADHG